MTSVNYNVAATTALRTLQATNKSLEATQNRVSTGLKIGEAKDNAAYWAISTTLKSDNKSLATVKDALNLGAATVDTAYQGLSKTLEVLDEIKSKLTAASQDGVDKNKIQSEIKELQNQLKSIATGANFSGENWLNVDSSAAGYSATKQVVSSYARDLSGSVTIGTIAIDLKNVALIDNGTTVEGILEGGTAGNANSGGLGNVGATNTLGLAGSSTGAAVTVTAPAVDNKFVLTYKVDGNTYTTPSDASTMLQLTAGGVTSDANVTAMAAALNANAEFASRATITAAAGGVLTITSKSTGATSSASVTGVAFFSAAGANTGATLGGTQVATAGVAASTLMATAFDGTAVTGNSLTLDANDVFEFDVTVDGVTSRASVNKALVDQTLGTSDGKIGSTISMQLVLAEALRNANVNGVTVTNTSNAIKFNGGDKTITIGNVNASKGTNLLTFDMSTASADQLTSYIRAVNGAAEGVTSAAATLGAVAKRIDLQNTFVDTLIDTIDKGVSGLIDADLSEESTRLQALQTKQQLGIQALSIANSSTQNVLSLFQN